MGNRVKPITEKDIQYAIEYAGQRLAYSFDPSRKPAGQYHLQPSNQRVPNAVATRVSTREKPDE